MTSVGVNNQFRNVGMARHVTGDLDQLEQDDRAKRTQEDGSSSSDHVLS